jgi:formylglycine-generating enzyme required for sulfatase activity
MDATYERERPVENVSWDDAQDYVSKLRRITGKPYRLPSEAEWEYAARAGDKLRYSGSDDVDNVAWYEGNSGQITQPVARKQANAWGLYDMSGNVWEWTEDCYHGKYDGGPIDGSAWCDIDSDWRVLRGGSWITGPSHVRSACRCVDFAGLRISFFGFRIAMTMR